MKKNLTELVFIIDESGSMSGLEDDTIGGFNSTLNKQREEDGEAFVTTVFFADKLKTIHDRLPITETTELTKKDYYPCGCTALLDAIGNSVIHIEQVHKYIRSEDIPENTVFVIITDGYENASRNYRYSQIKEMIAEKKKSNWDFIFIGANIDAINTAADLGIDEDKASNYISDEIGTRAVYKSMCRAISAKRCDGIITSDWKEALEEDYENRKKKKNK